MMWKSSELGRQQGGAALLLMMLGIILATSTILLVNLNRDDLRNRQFASTQTTLAAARTALIDYLVVNPDVNPGQAYALPCPDIDASGGFADGEAHTSACGSSGVSVIGRLPWRTIGEAAIKDAASACLWYIVSGSHKNAGADTAAMINVDSNGQLQLFDVGAGTLLEGQTADERPVAMIIAAMQPLTSQTRPGFDADRQCVPGANPASYLDIDAVSGIDNSVLASVVDGLDVLGVTTAYREDHNDRVVTISRADIERAVTERSDHLLNMRSLGLAAAACVADYGANNPGGVNDKRLPWPAPIAMSDYRPDASYDDADSGFYSGRLADVSDDSNTSTGNSLTRILSNCDSSAVPLWTAIQFVRWQQWKDNFFYAVAEAFSPTASVPSTCGTCLTVNGSGQYAAIVMFANSRLAARGQIRNAPPTDTDTKMVASNYLEDLNASNVPGGSAVVDYASDPVSNTFNDLLFCIDDQLVVSEC